MHPAVIGTLLNSALYLLCVFIAGMVTGNRAAWTLAIIAMGFTFVSHVIQLIPNRQATSNGFVIGSIILGVAAGLSLLF